MLKTLLVIIVIATVLVSVSVRVVRKDHRLVVLRLGRFLGVRGPGLVFRIPLIDSTFDVILEESVPGWKGLSSSQLEEQVKAAYFKTSPGQ